MSDLTDVTGSGATDTPMERTPPTFNNAQTDAILAIVSPLIGAAVSAAVVEARASTPTPTFRPGGVRAVDVVSKTCQVLLDGDDDNVPGAGAITAQTIGQHPYVGGRVLVVFSPPSAVYAIALESSVAPGTIAAFAGPVSMDTVTGDPAGDTFPPVGWLRCYGQLLTVADYTALYTAIGTTYNTGGESAGLQFRAPDLRGRTIFGLDDMGGTDGGRLSAPNTLGYTAGAEDPFVIVGGGILNAINGDDAITILPPYMLLNWMIKY